MTYKKTLIENNEILQQEEGCSSGLLYIPTSETIERLEKTKSYDEIRRVLDEQFVDPAISFYLESTEEQENYPLFLAAGEIGDSQIERNAALALYSLIYQDYRRNQYLLILSKFLNWPLVAGGIFSGIETAELFLKGTNGDFFWVPAALTSATYCAVFFGLKHTIFPRTTELKKRLETVRPITVLDSELYHEILTSQI